MLRYSMHDSQLVASEADEGKSLAQVPGAKSANQACQATVVNSIPEIVQWASQLIIGREKIYTGELHIV